MPRETSAGAVIFRKTRQGPEFLILHYSLGHWDFPKGNIEPGEEETETVRREIEEETGLRQLRFIEGYHESVSYYYRSSGETIFKVVMFHLVETRQKKVVLSHEHQGYGWFKFDQALDRLTYKNSKDVLLKALDTISERENEHGTSGKPGVTTSTHSIVNNQRDEGHAH